MLTRFHHTLIGVLVAQVALAVVLFARGGESGGGKETLLLPGFDAAKVTHVQITGAGAPPVELAKQGDTWVVASSFNYPVDRTKLDGALAPLAKLAAAETVASTKSRHAQLEVADDKFQRKVVIDAGGKQTTLYLGGAAGLRRNALRIGGSDDVYPVGGVSGFSFPNNATQWVSPHYLSIPKDQIAKVTIKRKDTLEFTHAADGKWTATVDGGPVDPVDSDEIDRLVTQLSGLDLGDPADPKRDASAPTATIAIELKAAPGASVAAIMVDVIEDGAKAWVHQRALDRAITVDKSTFEAPSVDKAKLVKAPEQKPAQ